MRYDLLFFSVLSIRLRDLLQMAGFVNGFARLEPIHLWCLRTSGWAGSCARASPWIQDGEWLEEREVCHAVCGPGGSELPEGLYWVQVLSKVSVVLSFRRLTTSLKNRNAFMKLMTGSACLRGLTNKSSGRKKNEIQYWSAGERGDHPVHWLADALVSQGR